MIESAYSYIQEGFGALPLKSDKSPMLPSGHDYLHSLIGEDNIDSLFMRAEKIGIACGEVSGGFYCLDFDAHKGENIRQIFNEFMRNDLVKSVIDSHSLPIFRTPSGGYHVYFKLDNKKYGGHYIAKWTTGEVMIEVRGNGQYVCLFPSKGYKQLAGSEIVKVATIEPEEKDALFSIAESFNQFIKTSETDTKGNGSWPVKFDTTKPIGRYNETEIEHAKELLIDAGWSYIKTRKQDNVELWLRPGKDAKQNGSPSHSATFGKFHNMFYVYTESDKVFSSWKGYALFDILLKLKFAGDFNAALKFVEDRYAPKITIPESPALDEGIEETPPAEVEFPIDVFPANVQMFIRELNDTLNYSKDFLALATMFTISVLNGNKYKLKVKNGWISPSIFWFAIVGEPGTMKSHPISMITHPISGLDKQSKVEYDHHIEEWEALENKGRKPRFKQILISDYTLESLHHVHDFNKRGIGLYKDELVGFLNDMNKYRKGSDEQFWLESFNNKSYIVNRVTKEPIFIEDININILGTIQPGVLNNVVRDFNGSGLVDRFLYSRAERELYPLPRREINTDWGTWWDSAVMQINAFFDYQDNDSTVLLSMNEEATDMFYKEDVRLLELQKSEGITLNFKGYINKMKTYLPRFALLMGLFDMVFDGLATEINGDQMKRAVKVIDYFLKSANNVFNESEKTMEINQVTSAMFGLTKKEKIIRLNQKGFRNFEIAKELNTPREVVSRILSKVNKGQHEVNK